ALADLLVGEGASVAVCGRDEERVRSTESRLRARGAAGGSGADALGVVADVTALGDLEAFVEASVARFGRIDGLVNNAGRSSAALLESVSDEEWQADFALKVLAAARLTRLAVPHLRAAGGGAIVNVLNIGARAPGAGSLPTSASRAAGLALTKSLSKELAPDAIRVNAILVGSVESAQWRRFAAAAGRSVDDLYRDLGRDIPLGRVGRAAEFADLAAFLLSGRASYVTGSAINLDGGASPVA
ncbi:MAG TPA: SDR family oxidoreductase, partial [Acidimicrobiales bacterium]|nr:SDR family oxidoreductase [Acidimicrobiales bacterium]